MSIDLQAKPQEKVLISVQLGTTDTGLFPQALIYNINDLSTVVDTINLAELTTGAYAKTWTTPESEAKYYVRITVYTDSYGGTVSPIDRPVEQLINVADSGGNGYLGTNLQTEINKKKFELSEQDKVDIADRVSKTLANDLIGIKKSVEKDNGLTKQCSLILDKVADNKVDSINRIEALKKLIKAVKLNVDFTDVHSLLGSLFNEIEGVNSTVVNNIETVKNILISIGDKIGKGNTILANNIVEVKEEIGNDKKSVFNLSLQKTPFSEQSVFDNPLGVDDDKDMKLAIDLINNPEKLKGTKISKKVLKNIVWLKGQK